MKFWKTLKAGGGNEGGDSSNGGRFGSLDRSNNNGSNGNGNGGKQQLQRRSCHGGSLGGKIRARLSGSSNRGSRDTSATDDIYEDFNTLRSNGSGNEPS